MLQTVLHYGWHFLAPGLLSYLCFKKEWKKAWIIMIATRVVDLDHLLANPIFDPNRCSINFHPLHSYYAITLYFLALIPVKTRIVATALLFHMLTDFLDCKNFFLY